MSEEPVVAELVSNSPTVRKAVKDALAPGRVRARGCGPRSVPHSADAVVTTGALSSTTERLAARVGTWQVYVMPEAAGALAAFVARVPGAPLIVGADLASVDRLAKSDLNVAKQAELIL